MALEDLITAVRASDPQPLTGQAGAVLFVCTTTDRPPASATARHLHGARRRLGATATVHREPEDRWLAALSLQRPHCVVSTRAGAQQFYVADGEGQERTRDHDRWRRRAGAHRRVTRRAHGRVRVRRESALQRRSVQRPHARLGGEGSREGARADAPAVSPLERVVGVGAPSRVRRRRREWRDTRPHARRLRFAPALLRGWRDRLLSGFAPARLRVEARRQGRGDVDDEPRRLDRSSFRRRGDEADAEPGRRHDRRCTLRTDVRSSCAPSDAPASRQTAGISRRTIERPERSAPCSHRPTCRWTTSSSPPTERRSGSPRCARAREPLHGAGCRRHTEAGGSGRSGRRLPARRRLHPVREIVARRTARSVSSGRRR